MISAFKRSVRRALAMRPLNLLIRGALNGLRGGYILCFHSDAAHFEQTVDALAPDCPVPLNELLQRLAAGKSTGGLFALTADDGERKSTRAFAEVCIRRQWPMTFYLLTGYMDGRNPSYYRFRSLLEHLPLGSFEVDGQHFDLHTPSHRDQFRRDLLRRFLQSRDEAFQPWLHRLESALIHRGLLAPGLIDPGPPPIPWEQVAFFASHEGLSFQSHGVTHQPFAALNEHEIVAELEQSRQAIERHTRQPVNHFCYPYGSPEAIGPVAPGLVARGYRSAVTLTPGRIKGGDFFRLPRFSGDDLDPSVACTLPIFGR